MSEVWSGGVNTWECDEMGHLNVRFWGAKGLEALAGLVRLMGMPDAFQDRSGSTVLIQEQHIRFLREARAGTWLFATGGVIEMGDSDARLMIVLHHANGDPAVTFQLRVSHVTAADLRPFPWSSRVRETCAPLMMQVPGFAAPRGVTLDPIAQTSASLEQAQAYGLMRIGMGTIQSHELDGFGRMRAEMFLGRVSDGIARLFGEDRAGPDLAPGEAAKRIGGAVLEYRILHHDWPRAGQHVEIRSGLAESSPRIRRGVHWMLDPVSDKPWVTAEAVAVNFDLDARKVVDINAAAQASFAARVVPGLGL